MSLQTTSILVWKLRPSWKFPSKVFLVSFPRFPDQTFPIGFLLLNSNSSPGSMSLPWQMCMSDFWSIIDQLAVPCRSGRYLLHTMQYNQGFLSTYAVLLHQYGGSKSNALLVKQLKYILWKILIVSPLPPGDFDILMRRSATSIYSHTISKKHTRCARENIPIVPLAKRIQILLFAYCVWMLLPRKESNSKPGLPALQLIGLSEQNLAAKPVDRRRISKMRGKSIIQLVVRWTSFQLSVMSVLPFTLES